ncbi:hypothetical protein AABB24_010474, partial [Solanum stoloniferum]
LFLTIGSNDRTDLINPTLFLSTKRSLRSNLKKKETFSLLSPFPEKNRSQERSSSFPSIMSRTDHRKIAISSGFRPSPSIPHQCPLFSINFISLLSTFLIRK